MSDPRVAAVAIGRNEGERLEACLRSLTKAKAFERIIYVDSGSTDGSVQLAEAMGVDVVTLPMDKPFTAARARNAGIARLADTGDAPDLVQFIDGDCVLDNGWLPSALRFLSQHPDVAVVCGRLRERFPERSVYNRLCDWEWNTPIGEAQACGGIALMRWTALQDVDGFNAALVAGEEPEMCLRMRVKGWRIWRLDAEMALHDAAMTRFSQFWARSRRGGFASAEAVAMHGWGPERHGAVRLVRALAWGAALPLAILSSALVFGLVALWALILYPLQVLRLALRSGGGRAAWEYAVFATLGKFAEAQGAFDYALRRLQRRDARLIEYK